MTLRGRAGGVNRASGVFQMMDECGCHGDGANEAVIWGAGQADGRESHTERNDTETGSLNITLFYYTDIHKSVSSLPFSSTPITSRLRLSSRLLFTNWD